MLRTALLIFLALCVLPAIAQAQQTFDVYILAGQSNADGRGLESGITGDLLERTTQTDAIISYLNPSDPSDNGGSGDGDVSSGGFVDLAPGFSVAPGEGRTGGIPFETNYFGSELSFAASIGEATGSDNQVAIIKVTRGGTNLRNDWRPSTGADDPGGFLYEALINQIDESLAALGSFGGSQNTVNVEGFLWHQGESDTGNSTNVGNYTGLFTDLVEGVRETVGEDIPVVLGQLGQDRTSALNDVFNTTLASFVNSTDVPDISLVSSIGLTNNPGDPTHFDANGQVLLGERFAAAFGPNEDDFASFTIDNADTDLDSAGIGGTVTALSENGVTVTLTTTDITGFADNTEGSALSSGAGAGHETNINSNSLGVNSSGSGAHSSEATNFNPGESLTFVLDEDVELLSIDLQSFDAEAENNGFRISADGLTFEITRGDLPLNANGDPEDATNFDFVFPEGLVITAGTEITFEAFSTTGEFNATDSFRIQDFSFNVISSVPEPSSLAILGLFGSLAAFRRRR